MATTSENRSRYVRKLLAVAALVIGSAITLAACGTPVQNAKLGRCANLPGVGGGTLCEEVGSDQYIFVDSLTGAMRRYNASEAQFIVQASASNNSSQATNTGSSNSAQRNCLSNPSIACSGSLNNRMTTYSSGGSSGVCSGGSCISMSR
jgi:hypothetical protein